MGKPASGKKGTVDGTKDLDLYFIAIVPDLELQTRVTALKNEIAEKYGSKHALRSPPHITLQMPFKWKAGRQNDLIQVLEKFSKDENSFEVGLNGYACFEPRVIFIDVKGNPKLISLQQNVSKLMRRELGIFNANYKDRSFHPHMTVALRDLRRAMFKEAWADFSMRKFVARFSVSSISLLKHHGHGWEVFKELKFSKDFH